MNTTFTIEEFEADVQAGEHEPAARRLLELLTVIDAHHGGVGGLQMSNIPVGRSAEELERHIAARLADAIGRLFCNPAFNLSDSGFFDFIVRHRWIGSIFAASPLRNADHLIRMMGGVAEDGVHLKLDHPALLKLCVLYTNESDLSLNCDELWYRMPRVCAALLMALLSPRLTISSNAHAKRESILGWLPSRLDQLQTAAALPQAFIHDVWMHCSYAMRDDKHAIKAPLNRLVRQQMLDLGLRDVDTPYCPPPKDLANGASLDPADKPVLMVVLEWFHVTHSIYRTHSLSMCALKAHYRLVGAGMMESTDEHTRGMFDEFIELNQSAPMIDNLTRLRDAADRLRPQIVYYPSLGMFPYTIYACNLRLAPMQVAALGHPATTHASTVDYVVVEEDYLGDPDCFAERLLLVPKDGIPYRPPATWPDIPTKVRENRDIVKVAVVAASMKLNAVYLQTCRQIVEQARTKVEFHFIPAFAIGLALAHARDEILRNVPGAVVHPTRPYDEYLRCINECDMFINPYPFGNTNGIVDTVRQGLPGVCRSGREVHSNIDEGMLRRLGLPEALITHDEAGYIAAAVELIDNHDERIRLSRQLLDPTIVEKFFTGDASGFARVMIEGHRDHPMRMIGAKGFEKPTGNRAAAAAAKPVEITDQAVEEAATSLA